MTGTKKIQKTLGLSLLLLMGVASNPTKPLKRDVFGGGILNSNASYFWDRTIDPNKDEFASRNADSKFRNYKGNVSYSRSNYYKYLYTYNLRQYVLNNDFNYYHNSTRTSTYHYSWENLYEVDGTCTQVAAANLVLSHETDIGYSWHQSGTYAEAYYLFYNAVIGSVSSSAMCETGKNFYEGTKPGDTDVVLTKTLYQMYEKYYGKNNIVEENFLSYSRAYDKCKQKIDQNKTCILSLYSHSVVCKGYEEYEYCWTETEDVYFMWWKTGTREVKKYKTFRYLAVDLGWGDSRGSTFNTRGRYNTCSWISEDDLYDCEIVSLK